MKTISVLNQSLFGLMFTATALGCPGGGASDDGSTSAPGTTDTTEGPTTGDAPTTTGDTTDTTDTAGNQPPTAPVVAIDPPDPDRKTDLTCAVTGESTDPDGDPVAYAFTWTRNGADAGISDPVVPAAQLEVGQAWVCTATPSDGTVDGPPGQAQATIGAVCAGLDFDGKDDVITAKHVSADVWTIEAWVYSRGGAGQRVILTQLEPSETFSGFELGVHESGAPYVFASDGMANNKAQAPEALSLGEWHHLAGIYDGTDLRLAVDGVLAPAIVPTGFVDSSLDLQIGSRLKNDFFFDGEIFEARVSSTARYTDNFAPEVGFVPDAETLALYRLDEGTGTVAADSSGNANDGAVAGMAAWTTTCPVTPTCGSLEFDGVDDVVTADHISTKMWTVEAWVYPRSGQAQQAIVSQIDNVNEAFQNFEIGIHDQEPYVFAPEDGDWRKVMFGAPITNDEWHHIAGIYDGKMVTIAVDGQIGPSALTSAFVDGTAPLQIGSRLSAGYSFEGTIADVRVSSTPRYTKNFAPPADLSLDAETLGLWRLDEGQGTNAAEAANGNDGDIAGMAEWSMTCPTGKPSPLCTALDFDGEDDVVTADHITAAVWTIEAWVYAQQELAHQPIVTQLNSTGVFEGFELGLDGDGRPYGYSPDGVVFSKVTADAPLPLNEWHHLAAIYDGTNLRLAVDGVLDADVVATDYVDSDLDLQIGGRIDNDLFFAGTIAGVRVSSAARYLADFSPPPVFFSDDLTLGLWRLVEGQGMVAADSSDDANDGAIAGMATWTTLVCPG